MADDNLFFIKIDIDKSKSIINEQMKEIQGWFSKNHKLNIDLNISDTAIKGLERLNQIAKETSTNFKNITPSNANGITKIVNTYIGSFDQLDRAMEETKKGVGEIEQVFKVWNEEQKAMVTTSSKQIIDLDKQRVATDKLHSSQLKLLQTLEQFKSIPELTNQRLSIQDSIMGLDINSTQVDLQNVKNSLDDLRLSYKNLINEQKNQDKINRNNTKTLEDQLRLQKSLNLAKYNLGNKANNLENNYSGVIDIQKLNELRNRLSSLEVNNQLPHQIAVLREDFAQLSIETKQYANKLKEAEKNAEQLVRTNSALSNQKFKQDVRDYNFGDLMPNLSLSGSRDNLESYIKYQYSESAEIVKDFRDRMLNTGEVISQSNFRVKEGADKWRNYQVTINKANNEVRLMDRGLSDVMHRQLSFNEALKIAITRIAQWGIATNVVYGSLHSLQDGLSTLKELDGLLIDISKVTNMTADSMERLKNSSFDTASSYGRTAQDYLKGVAEFSRAGYEETAKGLSELALLSQNVGELTSEQATQFLLATDAAYKFKGSQEELLRVLDGVNEIDNKFATSISRVSEGMTVAGSVASNAGIGIDELASAVGVMTAVTQRSGNEAGRALRSILMNIRQIKGETEDGEIIDDASISKSAESLANVGIKVYELRNGIQELRNPMDVLKDLANIWDNLSTIQQSPIIESLAGKYRANQLTALLENFDMYEKMMQSYMDSINSAMDENTKRMSGWAQKVAEFQNSVAKMWNNTIETDTVKDIIDLGTEVVGLIDKFGLLNTVVVGLIGGLSFSGKFKAVSTSMARFKKELFDFDKEQQLMERFYDLTGDASLKTANSVNVLTKAQKANIVATKAGAAALNLLKGAISTLLPMLAIGAGLYFWEKFQEGKRRTEEINVATVNFTKTLETFQKTGDPSKINAIAEALRNVKEAVNYDDTTEQIKKLEKEITDLQNKASNDRSKGMQTGDLTAYSQDIALLGMKKEKLKELQDQLVVVTDKTNQYKDAVLDSVDKTKSQVGIYDKILQQIADGHEFTSEEAKKLIQVDGSLSKAFEVNGESANVNAQAIKNLKEAALDQAITAVQSSITQTKAIISNSIDRTNAYVLEAESLNSLADVYNEITKQANDITGGSSDAGINTGIRKQLEKSYAPLIDLYNKKDELERLKNGVGGLSGYSSNGKSSSSANSPDTSLNAYYDALIRLTRASADLTSEKNKLTKADIESAKSANDYNRQLELTTSILSGQKEQIDQLQVSTKALQDEYKQKSSTSGFDTTSWFDNQGEATLEFNRQYLKSNKEVQESMKEVFDILQKLKKGWLENDSAVNELRQSQIELQNSLFDIKNSMADQLLDSLKKSYETQRDIALKTIEAEMDALEKSHDRKMDILDEELDAYEKTINTKLKSIEKESDSEDFSEQLSKAQAEAQDIQRKINILSLDDSIEANSQREDLEKQLSEKLLEIAEMQKDRYTELQKEALQDQLDSFKEEIEAKKKAEQTKYQSAKDTLVQEQKDKQFYYDQMINSEQYYADMRYQIVSGNVDAIKTKLLSFLEEFKSVNEDTAKSLGISYSSLLNTVDSLNSNVKPTVRVIAGSVDERILQDQFGDSINYSYAGTNQFTGGDRRETNAKFLEYLKKFGLNPRDIGDLWQYHEGGLVGTTSAPNRITDLINKMFNTRPDESIVKSLVGELQVPPQNIMKNFVPNMQNLMGSLGSKGQILNQNNSIVFNVSGANGLSKQDLQKAAEFVFSQINNGMKINYGVR